jgi:transcriptional regulator with XRE-family HTH domain
VAKTKTYKDFGIAVEDLKGEEISYYNLSQGVGLSESYLWGLVNKRKVTLPKDKVIEKLAKFFHVEPSYFYEYRLRRVLEFIDQHREFLDTVERSIKAFETADKRKEAAEYEGRDEQAVSSE